MTALQAELTAARAAIDAAQRRADEDDRGVQAAVPGGAAVPVRHAEVREARSSFGRSGTTASSRTSKSERASSRPSTN